jgi:hypothetical protein
VFCHRDPLVAVASAISLWCTIASQEWPNYDSRPAARHMLKRFADGWNLTMDILDQMKAQGKDHMAFHIYYKDLVKDPIDMVTRVHAYFKLAPPSREKLQTWLDENPSGKHGSHKYSLEEFGLTPKDVYIALHRYYLRFFPDLLPSEFRILSSSL